MKANKPQTLKIIGGEFRGKKLHFPEVDGLRPTPNRVRETLFNWLMHDIRDASCLDAFAGSGALGFEALSRGAAHVTLLEKQPIAYNNLLKQASSFHSNKITVKHVDACDFIKHNHSPFTIVFLDPPFAKNYLPVCLNLLAKTNLLVENGLLYMESPQTVEIDPNVWHSIKVKKAGQIVYGLYKKIS